MLFPNVWKAFMRLSTPLFITLMILTMAMRCDAQALFTPIDASAPEITEALLEIPASFKPVDKGLFLQTVTSHDIKKAFHLMYPSEEDNYKKTGGLYLTRPRDGSPQNPTSGSIILIVENQGVSYTTAIVVHEYGHWVEFELTNDAERSEWNEIWGEEVVQGKHVTHYAGKSSDEGFAESFLYWVRNRPRVSAVVNTYFTKLSARLAVDERARKDALSSLPPITSDNPVATRTDVDFMRIKRPGQKSRRRSAR